MAQRKPKRERKKAAAQARREEWRRAVQRRRRQRWGVLLGSLLLIGIGVLVATIAFDGDGDDPAATPTTDPSAADTIAAPVREPVACDADLPGTAGSEKRQYGQPQDQELDPDTTYIWRLETSCGVIEVELDVTESPQTSNSIAFLTREGFYDGLLFHRIIEDFVIQGGDPQGTGGGGSGYDVVEPPPDGFTYETGTVAMAKTEADPPGTSGSQFYIVSGAEGEELPPIYAYLGRVVEGMDVVTEIEDLAGEGGAPPTAWAYIERATIEER